MQGGHFFEILGELKAKVDQYIFGVLPKEHEIPEIAFLYSMMRDYPSRGGKGLRPGLVLIFNRAFGGCDDKAMNTAAAMELFQNWIVIHDDIEDQSQLRRGLPALHIKHGVPLALNAGDALAGKMWELLLRNADVIGPQKAMDVFGEFLHMHAETTAGQHIELSWVHQGRWDISENDYFEMCRRKTAWYTCITPAWAGSLIAGAARSARDDIVKFGRDLGVAFQIQDDVLNLVGDLDKYGKEIGGDLLEGKRTLVMIDLLRKCSPTERRSVLDALDAEREVKKQKGFTVVFDLMQKYGSIEYAVGVSQKLAKQARQTFAECLDGSIDRNYRTLIIDLIDFVVNREL